MTRQTIFILILFSIFLGVVTVWAYKPGPDIIRECPHCKARLIQHTTRTGNTIGARVWTDGKRIAPMLPDRPRLVKCPVCSSLFWLDKAKELKRRDWSGKDDDWPGAIEPLFPTEADFLLLLTEEGMPRKKEIYLRIHAWWAGNDVIRKNENSTESLSSKQELNLQSLASLLDEMNPDQRIAKAEIFRELKMFDQCVSLLKLPFEEKHHTKMATFISGLAEQRSWTVHEFIRDGDLTERPPSP